MRRLGRLLRVVVAVLLVSGAVAVGAPQEVLDDYNDNNFDYTLDKPHSWADLNEARARFSAINPAPLTAQFSREVDRVIETEYLGIEPTGRVSGVTSAGRVPWWVKVAAVGGIVMVVLGIVAAVWRRQTSLRPGGST